MKSLPDRARISEEILQGRTTKTCETSSEQKRGQQTPILLKLQMDWSGELCSTESEGTGEEKHFVFICTGLANMQSALISPEGAHVISVPKRHLVDSAAPSGQGEPHANAPCPSRRKPRRGPCPGAHLQDDGELLRGVAVLHAHGQPHLESRQLLRKEGAVLLERERECKFGLKKELKKKNI